MPFDLESYQLSKDIGRIIFISWVINNYAYSVHDYKPDVVYDFCLVLINFKTQ